ncbi:hypothetical protein EB118_13985 [bacterium]|nr:hypothetical protein [bacterium]
MALTKDLKVDGLDFESIKSNFINYLKTQDQFRDYNFDASGMQVLLDLLAYNTYYNSFYLNMIANENFLATAQKRNSVVNLARSLNYTPRSTSSAKIIGLAVLSVTGSPAFITIPAFTKFQGVVDGKTYVFNTTEAITVVSTDGIYSKEITLTEGQYITERFTVNTNDPDQRFLISNKKMDTTTISVRVQNSSVDLTTRLFTKPDNLVEIDGNSRIFFIEEVEDGYYELFFGDDALGVALDNNNVIIVEYLISNGSNGNDVKNLTYTDSINGVTNIIFIENESASGGAEIETTNKIKFNAPKSYEAQNRAVTVEDYKALILKQPNVQSVSIWGGEDNVPATYGTVYISVKPIVGEFLSSSEKDVIIQNVLKPKKILTVRNVIVDPEYIYLIVNSTVKYDSRFLIITESALKSKIIQTIKNYNDDDINEFSKYFRFSKLSRLIDTSDRAIINSTTTIQLRKETEITLGQSKKYELSFSNPINNTTLGRPSTHPYGIGNQLTSNEFSYAGFERCFLEDNNGIIRVYRLSGTTRVGVNNDTGTIDYNTGNVILNSFMPTAFVDGGVTLKLTANSSGLDILPLRNQIISIRDADITVNAVDDRTISLVNR